MNSAHKMVLHFAFFLLYVPMSNTAEILRECDKDSDCGEGYYCTQYYCERCIPCPFHFNRHPPLSPSGQVSCARFEDDCGSCLPGYQADDLTNQRYSMECYPLPEKETTFTFANFSWTGLLWIVAIIFVTVAFVVCFIKCRSRLHPIVKKEEEQLELIAPIPHPPPYASLFPETVDETDHLIGSVRESDVIVVRVDQEHCSRAIPIGYDDDFNFQRQEESESEADEPVPITEVSDRESSNGNNDSTETIPSLWEPTPSITNMSMNLVRSQSLELPRIHRAIELVRVASDPALSRRRRISLGGENYSHRHVRLSQYRLESQNASAAASTTETDKESCRESCSVGQIDDEPKTPEPFPMGDEISDSSGRPYQAAQARFLVSFHSDPTSGSQDSGFQDQSRRRQLTAEQIAENNFPLKRRRRNYSDNSEENDCSLSDENE